VTPEQSVRPPLDSGRLAGLTPDVIADVSIEVLDAVPSTNAVAVQRAQAGAADGHVVVADHQTGGRGRLDRTWETPRGSALTFSVVLRPSAPTRSWPWLPLLTGYAVDKALKAQGYDAGVKWPNDVLIGEKKVAGILIERIETPQGPAAVVGVGLNVGMTQAELPVPTATSLAIESGTEPDRTDVLLSVLTTLREAYDAWQAGGDHTGLRLAESYAAACVTVGQDVRVDLPDGSALLGRATGVDPGGRLVVESLDGTQYVAAGDVVHVRPADQ
jgi:BirA family biotin operon repressor/biotin-[acetyl-CoA-carboxylase] ligase